MEQWVEKIRAEHAKEIENVLKAAREEWTNDNKGTLCIQRVATAHEYQKEIFDIETELLETLDELETMKTEQQRERQEMQNRIYSLEKELVEEKKRKKDVSNDLESEVDMLRANFVAAAEDKKERKLLILALQAQVNELEDSLKEAREKSKLKENDIAMLESELKTTKGLLSCEKEKAKAFQKNYSDLKAQFDKTEKAVLQLENEKTQLTAKLEEMKVEISEVEALKSHILGLQQENARLNVNVEQSSLKKANTENILEYMGSIKTMKSSLPEKHASEYSTPMAKKPEGELLKKMTSMPDQERSALIRKSATSAFDQVSTSHEQTTQVPTGRTDPLVNEMVKDDPKLTEKSVKRNTQDHQQALSSVSQSVDTDRDELSTDARREQQSNGPSEARRRMSGLSAPKVIAKQSGLKPPSSVRATSARSRTSGISRIPQRSIVEPSARKERNKVKPMVPRPSEVSKSMTAANGIQTSNGTIANRSALPQPGTIRKGAIQSRRSNVPKFSTHSKPAWAHERIRNSIAPGYSQQAKNNAKKLPATEIKAVSEQPRTRLSLQVGIKTTSTNATPSRTRTNERSTDANPLKTPLHFATPMQRTHFETFTPHTEPVGGNLQGPSSQQVRDKFSSLCEAWSTTKKSECRDKDNDLPTCLQLDTMFDGSLTPLVKAKTMSEDMSNKVSSQVVAEPFSMATISAVDDEDDELLLSPIPRANHCQKTEHKKLDTVASIITVQAFIRSFLARCALRKLKKDHHLRMRKAVQIQSALRCYLARQDLEKRQRLVHRKIRSAVSIQATWRMHWSKVLYMKKKTCVCILQRAFRRKQQIKKIRNFMKLQRSAVLITNCMRCVAAKIFVSKLRNTLRCQTKAAIRLQSHWRRHQALLVFKDHQEKIRAVVRIQSVLRQTAQRVLYLRLQSAACRLQCWYRGICYRKTYVLALRGITKLQAAMRSKISMKNYVSVRRSICLIQSLYRCHQERRSFTNLRDASIRIQKQWKQRQEKLFMLQLLKDSYRVRSAAALRIQSLWRAHTASIEVTRFRNSIVKIQANFRLKMAQRRYRASHTAVVRLQAMARGSISRKHFDLLKRSMVTIQSQLRGYFTRVKLQQEKESAIQIQACIREYMTRSSYAVKRSSAIRLQAFWRGSIAVGVFDKQRTAIIKLQAWYKACRAQDSYRKELVSAAKLQCFFRTKLAVKKYAKLKHCVLVSQSFVRAWLARKNFKGTRASVRLIQGIWRKHAIIAAQKKQTTAIIMMQSAWRMRMVQNQFRTVVNSICLIQTYVRSRNKLRVFRRVRSAIIVLQSHFRGHQHRTKLRHIHICAVRIQSQIRQLTATKSYKKTKRAALVIQKMTRRVIARRVLLKLLEKKREEEEALRQQEHSIKLATPVQKASKSQRKPLSTLRDSSVPQSSARRPAISMKKSSRKPLGSVSKFQRSDEENSSIFSPAKTRGLKRTLDLSDKENASNITDDSPSTKRQKPDTPPKPTEVRYPAPEKMKVVELRDALQNLGVQSRDYRKLRKAQLISMVQQVQEGVEIATVVQSLAS
jgi:myosin heavy subunit